MLLDIPRIPDIPEGWKYLAGSLAGGGIAIIVTFLNNRYQLRKDTQQWEREKLWNGYQKCISNLNLMESLWPEPRFRRNISGEPYIETIETSHEVAKELLSLYSEIYPYLHWIIYNYPNSTLKEIKTLKETIEKREGTIKKREEKQDRNFKRLDFFIPTEVDLLKMKQELIQLMTNDPRLLKK